MAPRARLARLPRRRVLRTTEEGKARWLDASARLDANAPDIAAHARRFVDAYGFGSEQTARAIHAWTRDAIAYARDPHGQEELADAATVLARRYDDCDGKSRLCVATWRAAGVDARIRAVFDKDGHFRHVQAECRYPGSSGATGVTADGWVPAELTIAGVGLGEPPSWGERDARGKLVLAGPPAPTAAVRAVYERGWRRLP